jgi:hypothetical protein
MLVFRDRAQAVFVGLEELGIPDLVGVARDGTADLSAGGLGDGSGVGGAFGCDSGFHLGEQGEEQERDAAHALVGGGLTRFAGPERRAACSPRSEK